MRTHNARRKSAIADAPVLSWLLASLSIAGCRDELGQCDKSAAEQLVYSRTGLVATKGQALMHDSCGQGSTCHSAAATGKNRVGTPRDSNFDMLPHPTGVHSVIEQRQVIWDQVTDGLMPPRDYQVGDSEWAFDSVRSADGTRLPALSTEEGRGILRNWLACNAPTVPNGTIPIWAKPAETTSDTPEQRWTDLYGVLRRDCTSSGCHDGVVPSDGIPDWASVPVGSAPQQAFPDGSVPGILPVPFASGECAVYKWLLYQRDRCGQRLVIGGDPDHSSLLDKVENVSPVCGATMPPPDANDPTKTSRLTGRETLNTQIRGWIVAGALAPQCAEWSDCAPRTGELDAGSATASTDWRELYTSIIGPRCATAGCHVTQSAKLSGELDLSNACEARRALVEQTGPCGARVSAGDANSNFMDKLTSETPRCGARMPPGAPLSSKDIAALRAWVEAGASAGDCP